MYLVKQRRVKKLKILEKIIRDLFGSSVVHQQSGMVSWVCRRLSNQFFRKMVIEIGEG